MSFLRDSGGAAVLQLTGAALQFLAGWVVATWLLPDGRGVFALIVLVPEITRAFAHLGFGTASTKLTAQNHSISARVTTNAISFCLFVSAVCCGGLVLFFPWLLEFVKGDGFERVIAAAGGIEIALYLSIFSLPLLILEGYLGGQLVALGAILSSNVAKVAQTGSFAALVLGLFYTQGATTVFLLFRLDIALVRQWRSMSEVGVYSVAASLAMMFQVIGFAVERSLVPRLMSRGGEETKILTPLATRSFIAIGFPIGVVAALGGWLLIPIVFGSEYSGAILPFALFLPGLVFANVGQICNTDLIGRGHPQWASISASIALVINIILNVILIPRMGIVGAAIASLVCYSQHGITLAFMYSRVVGVSLRQILVPGREDLSKIIGLFGRRS